MQIERRALYNSLRMNWHNDPTTEAEPWQIEDYRILSLETLFARLKGHQVSFDRTTFTDAAQDFETPEDFTDYVLQEREFEAREQDQIYLLIFELWRRLLPENQAFSIFCDEIDHRIFAYDQSKTSDSEAIQDMLTNLQAILDENVDEGAKPEELFDAVCHACANDIENFLYDYISEQIDLRNTTYAAELIEGFSPYVHGIEWFDLLRARLLSFTDEEECKIVVKEILKYAIAEPDMEYNFELLAFLTHFGNPQAFLEVAKTILNKIELEEDFHDLLAACADYCHFLDDDARENAVRRLMQKRSKINPEASFLKNDPDCKELIQILTLR